MFPSSLYLSSQSCCSQNVTFEDFYVDNVDNPIYLNQVRRPLAPNTRAYLTDTRSQCYETAANICAEYPSTLSISDVHCTYPIPSLSLRSSTCVLDINVTSMSSGKAGNVVVQLECSAECYDITATGINLTSPDGQPAYYCQNIANETALDFACMAPPVSSS